MRHIDVTKGKYRHLTLLRAKMLMAARQWFYANKYIEVPCPHITGAGGSCEYFPNAMGVTMFDQEGQEKRMFLRQTGQLYLEAFTQEHDKVFTIGPSFRQEKKVTDRHLCEFLLIEMEALNLSLEELMDSIESVVKSMYSSAINLYGDEEKLKKYVSEPFKRIAYREAIQILQEDGWIEYGDDFSSSQEQYLCTYLGGPVFVSHYPTALDADDVNKVIKFFSMKRDMKAGYTLCADLLLPGVGESVGSAVREGDPDVCKAQLEESIMLRQMKIEGIDESEFDWYFDVLAQTPSECHSSGCGIGFERVVQSVLSTLSTEGTASIKDSVEIPRSPEYLYV